MPTVMAKRPGAERVYRQILADLAARADNAAIRNKATMWAYYLAMHAGLQEWFADCVEDGAFAGAALALSQRAVERCPTEPPAEAARLWALGVYARRILRAWSGHPETVSLDWLRTRQLGLFNEHGKRRPKTRPAKPSRRGG